MRRDKTFIVKVTNNCNLNCPYCYHFNNINSNGGLNCEMSLEVVEKTIQTLLSFNKYNATFIWHGGEPLLQPLEFYKNIVELQNKYKKFKTVIRNCIQTNGVLLNDEYIKFFKKNKFQVGISLDGYGELYCNNRRAPMMQFNQIMKNIELMQQEQLQFGIISVITNEALGHEQELFDFYIKNKITNIAFLPAIVETNCVIDEVASLSVKGFYSFLTKFFDIWAQSNTEIKVREFDEYLRGRMAIPHKLCVNSNNCSDYLTVSPSGDIYLCDSFPMLPEWRVGTVYKPLKYINQDERYKMFNKKIKITPPKCRGCKNRKICNGGCKYRRWLADRDFKEPQYLCLAYKAIYKYFDKQTNGLL